MSSLCATTPTRGMSHDLALTDRRKPTVNAKGLIYGATELGSDDVPVLDPVRNVKSYVAAKLRDDNTPSARTRESGRRALALFRFGRALEQPLQRAYADDGRARSHLFAAQVRAPKNTPDYCTKNSPIRSAQLYPLPARPEGFVGSARQVSVYDPSAQKWSFIDTCFGSHHLNFAEDADDTLFLTMSARASLRCSAG